MAKTLADMTAEERADCVGRWALIEGINLAVIVEVDETDTCVVIYPEWQSNTAVHLNEMVAPRFDLPRAWTPDGELIIFGGNDKVVGTHAPGTWAHVRGYAEEK